MFKILDEACTPTRGSKYSAAVDLRAREDVTIAAGETVLVPLGVKIKDIDSFIAKDFSVRLGLEDGEAELDTYQEVFKSSHYLQLMLRSGLGKKGLVLPNGVGVIDLDYKDEIMMIVHNPVQLHRFVQNCENRTTLAFDDDIEFTIKKGDRVGQITLLEHKSYLFGIDTDEVRAGGFGSTGTK